MAGEFEFAAAVGVIDIDGALKTAWVQYRLTRHGEGKDRSRGDGDVVPPSEHAGLYRSEEDEKEKRIWIMDYGLWILDFGWQRAWSSAHTYH